MPEQYCLYLRKSRADMDAEKNGDEDTLLRHEKLLMQVAKSKNLNITDIYREVVSGETISARPQMQRLLSAVGQGVYTGVLVVEVERLARGDTIDQGLVAQAFKFSNTLIITPTKTYDPNNEFDEEYFEFGLFMSRREYKTINRRLQRGRIASVQEGKFVGSITPYGYDKVKLEHDKGYMLVPNPDEAPTVRLIFSLYVNGLPQEDGTTRRLGVAMICRYLNEHSIPNRTGNVWVNATVRDMLRNIVYDGKTRWNWRPTHKKMVDGIVKLERPRTKPDTWIISDGMHEPLIDHDTFVKAQVLIDSNPPRPIGERETVRNPLAGIVICGKCGRRMVRRPKGSRQPEDVIMCGCAACHNVSVYSRYLEGAIIDGLKSWVDTYKLQCSDDDVGTETIAALSEQRAAINKQIQDYKRQRENVYTLLEQGVYTTETFLQRLKIISDKIGVATSSLADLEQVVADEERRLRGKKSIIPKIENLLAAYWSLDSAAAKNDMLKEVIEKVVYEKDKGGRWADPTDFHIKIYPRLPRN